MFHQFVTNITLTGSAMANRSRGLIQGVTTLIVVSICALGLVYSESYKNWSEGNSNLPVPAALLV